MDTSETKKALQELIIRLQDAEKGSKEIALATSLLPLKQWLEKYSTERHRFHTILESHSALYEGDPEVKASFLGTMHRMFIDVKINNTDIDSEFTAIAEEIERGATTLISDYSKVMDELVVSSILRVVLEGQRGAIEKELTELVKLKDELMAEAS